MTADPPAAPAARPFGAVLHELRGGLLASELADHLQELTAAVAEHRKSGKLTLTLTLTPEKGGAYVTVSDAVTVKAPEPVRSDSIFFLDEAHNLVREDPRQTKFELREAPQQPTEVKGA